MTPYSQRFMFRLLGISRELACFETEAEQHAAYVLVRNRVYRGSLRAQFIFVSGLVFVLFFKFLAQPLGAALRVTAVIPQRLYEWIAMLAIASLLTYGMLWLVRGRFARELRAYLNEKGIPTCMDCGYNLTGTVEPRCPECGASAQPVRK